MARKAEPTYTLADVWAGAANFMLGNLQMVIAGGESITPERWQQAIDQTVAFQLRIVAAETSSIRPCEPRPSS